MRLILHTASCCLLGLLILFLLSPQPASAQTCDDNTRQKLPGGCRSWSDGQPTRGQVRILPQLHCTDF
jgi:hypothetical protein